MNYQAVRLPNGCMVEAVVFADWFMEAEIDGPASWAQAVFIRPTLRGREIEHAVAIFRYARRFYVWDAEWGCLPMPPVAQNETSLAGVAERAYREHFESMVRRAASGASLPDRSRQLLEPGAEAPIASARSRLQRTRPTLLIELAPSDGTALAFMVQERVHVYHPAHGTAAASLSAEGVEVAIRRIAASWRRELVALKLETLSIPPPEKQAARASNE